MPDESPLRRYLKVAALIALGVIAAVIGYTICQRRAGYVAEQDALEKRLRAAQDYIEGLPAAELEVEDLNIKALPYSWSPGDERVVAVMRTLPVGGGSVQISEYLMAMYCGAPEHLATLAPNDQGKTVMPRGAWLQLYGHGQFYSGTTAAPADTGVFTPQARKLSGEHEYAGRLPLGWSADGKTIFAGSRYRTEKTDKSRWHEVFAINADTGQTTKTARAVLPESRIVGERLLETLGADAPRATVGLAALYFHNVAAVYLVNLEWAKTETIFMENIVPEETVGVSPGLKECVGEPEWLWLPQQNGSAIAFHVGTKQARRLAIEADGVPLPIYWVALRPEHDELTVATKFHYPKTNETFFRIASFPLDGGPPRRLVDASRVSWSPDGTRFVYAEEDRGLKLVGVPAVSGERRTNGNGGGQDARATGRG